MNETTPETRACPYCGAINSGDRSLCSNCQSPLTAYAGQLSGPSEADQMRRAQQKATLTRRPPAVVAMTAFDIFFAVFWPLAYVVGAFLGRQAVNAEGTNYLAAAFGAVGPFLAALLLVPFAVGLLVVAWLTWTQQTVAWNLNLGVLALFALRAVTKFGMAAGASLFWMAAASVLLVLWIQRETKAWFGYS